MQAETRDNPSEGCCKTEALRIFYQQITSLASPTPLFCLPPPTLHTHRLPKALRPSLATVSSARCLTTLAGLRNGSAYKTASAQHSKKRKLNLNRPSTVTQAGTPGSAVPEHIHSPASSPSRATRVGATASPDPPRFIPPHLHNEVLETPSANDLDNTARDYSTTAASSPSDAYADLSLNGGEGAVENIGMSGQRRDSLALGDDTTSAAVNHTATTQQLSAFAALRQQSRSPSPAKRRASEMDDGNASDGNEQMDIDRLPSPSPQPSIENDLRSTASGEHRETRDASVDMLSSTTNLASSETSPKSSDVDATSTGASSVSAPASDGEIKDIPSLNDQVRMIHDKVMSDTLVDGQVGYMVATKWLQRVLARCEEGAQLGPFDKEALEGEIGALDNGPLLPLGTLDQSLRDDHDELFVPISAEFRYGDEFYILPQEAYDSVVQWYGVVPAQPIIKRYAHATSETNVQWEVHPPIFTLRKLRNENGGVSKHLIQDAKSRAPRIVASRNSLFQAFLSRAKASTEVPKTTKIRVWRVLNPDVSGTEVEKKSATMSMLSPPASREPSPASPLRQQPLLMDLKTFNELSEGVDRIMIDVKDETNNEKYNGSLQLGTAGLGADETIIIDEQDSRSPGDTFTSDHSRKTGNKSGLSLNGKKNGLLSQNSSGRSSPTGIMTRGRNRAQGRSKGTVGLANLGNTCYMNSALQCIRATEELSAYFLEGQWKAELNIDNVLGFSGQMAKTYAGFLEAVYQPSQNSFTPRNFKATLGKCGPQFSGFGQQDSQEFMSFLVDALHEDLNRIHKKPYTENPDSDDKTVNDPEAVKALGEVFRKNYRLRNDSVVMDLFNGFYKNTMVCPECDKISITFDPYSLLTLQLPIEHSWQGTISLFPVNGKSQYVEIDMDKHSTVRTLKEYVASKVPGLDSRRLMFAEVFSHKFFRTVDDKQTIMEVNIGARDDMIMYELDHIPSNFPPPKKKQKKYRSMLNIGPDSEEEDIPENDTPLSDRMMVPVFHRAQLNYGNNKSLALTPSFITLTRDEAQNHDEILRKVLGQAANLTTRDIFVTAVDQDNATESTAEEEQDTVITTEEDASSIAEPSIQARSVEGEDGIVDITMSGTPEGQDEVEASVDPDLASLVKAKIMAPGARIPHLLHTLFELKYMPAGSDMIQTGWSNFDQGRNYPSIASRIPKPPRASSPSSASQSPTPSDESSDVDDIPDYATSAHPSFAETTENTDDVESETEDPSEMFSAKPSASMNRKGNGKNKNKNRNRNKTKLKTYSKKGKHQQHAFTHRRASESSDAATEVQTDGNPSLIRLGEAIILDWDKSAYHALFGGPTSEDSEGGEEFRKYSETLADPELDEKKKVRQARKKHGVSLDECFRETAKGEILTEENAWYCNRCKELRRASKKLEIWTAPDILVIHLKRFSANRQFRDKIDVLVDFPIEGLDLTGKVGITEGKEMVYDLFAVDNHYGGLGGGHYTAFAKNFVDQKWYEYNDSSVSSRRPESVITPAAYLLFYRRRSNAPLGSTGLQDIVDRFRNPNNEEDSNSDTESLSESPSGQGKGQRLDGSSLNFPGSSSALVVAGAGRPLLGGDGLAASNAGMIARTEATLDHDYDADEDEGIAGMEYGPDLPPPAYSMIESKFDIKDTTNNAGWGWTALNGGNLNADEDKNNDNDSNLAADGDVDGEYEDDRLLQDFGDDLTNHPFGSSSGHQNSPTIFPLGHDEYEEVGVPDVDMGLFEDDGPVAEVRIEDSPPLKAEIHGDHIKTE